MVVAGLNTIHQIISRRHIHCSCNCFLTKEADLEKREAVAQIGEVQSLAAGVGCDLHLDKFTPG